MKFYCLQENLKAGLQAVSHVVGKNINLPILNNVFIEAKKEGIRMVATDLEIGVVNTIRGKVEKEGVFTVDSKLFSDYVSFLPNKKVDINVENNELGVSCENNQTKIKGLSAEDYPLIPEVIKENPIKLNLNLFKQGLNQVIFATSSNDSRIELTGILFKFTANDLYLVATDSFRLTEKRIKLNNKNTTESDIIIPAKAAQELLRIAANVKDGVEDKKEVEIYISDNQVMFVIDSIELITRIIEGQFPDYHQIIPTNIKTTALVNKNDFVRSVKMSALFSKKDANDINLDFPGDKNKIMVSSSSSTTGESYSNLEAAVKGTDNAVVINYKYLLEGINNIDSEHIKIELVDSNTPCVLRGEKQNDYFNIIMPIKQ